MNLIEKYLGEGVDWKDFYKMATTKAGGYSPVGASLKDFEAKYAHIMERPHIVDALDKTNDFKSFLKAIKKFEK